MIYALWAGFAIGLAGLGACIGEGMLTGESLEVLWKHPKLWNKVLVFTILFLALIESAAIYGLIVAFSIMGK